MAEILQFELSKKEYLELANKTLKKGAVGQSIIYLKKAIEIDDSYYDAYLRLAQVYNEIGQVQISNAILFSALATNPEEEDKSRIFYLLGMNFLGQSEVDIATYYLQFLSDYFETAIEEKIIQKNNSRDEFSLVYPRDDNYYNAIVEKAYVLIKDKKYDEAIELLAKVDEKFDAINSANHVTLVCYMMKNDIDRVIYMAEKMLKKSDNLAVKCTLATAYLLEDKKELAHAVLDDVLKKDYKKVDEILLIMPLLVNMEAHAEIVKYTTRVLESLKMQPNTMVWLSQGLYNIGQKSEATKLMTKIKNIFEEFSPAEYFLELFKQNPETVEYSMNIPYKEVLRRFEEIKSYLSLGAEEFVFSLENDENLQKLFKWVFMSESESHIYNVIDKLDSINSSWVESFYRTQLVTANISYEVMARIIHSLVNFNHDLEFDVVAQSRFKNISLLLPKCYYYLPSIMQNAVGSALCDIIFTDEEPNHYIVSLSTLIDELYSVSPEHELIYHKKELADISKLRSLKTLVGVLIAKVYEDDEDIDQESIDRYELSYRTFEKYYKILFED